MAEKATKMLIKVDLQCCRCYKKIKKILCEYPHIRDQIYDEKQNTVMITVVCCSPEKIRDKIICKGGKTVQSVEILPEKKPEKPPEEKPKEDKKPSNGSKAKGSGKDPEPTKKPEPEKKPAKQPQPNGSTANGSGPKPTNPDPEPAQKPEEPEKKPAKQPQPQPQPPLKTPELAPGYLTVPIYLTMCCCPCYGGYGWGPCYCNGQRRPVMCYDGCGRPACVCQGGSRRY